MLSKNLRNTLRRSFALANARGHDQVTLEHLLMALIDDLDVLNLLESREVDVKHLKARLGDFLENEVMAVDGDQPQDAEPTAAFQRAVQRAAMNVQVLGQRTLDGRGVLAQIFAEPDSAPCRYLQELPISRLAVEEDIKRTSCNS